MKALLTAFAILFTATFAQAEEKKGASAAGVLKSIDSSKVTLAGKKMEGGKTGADQMFDLAANATVMVDGKDAKAADLKEGVATMLTLDKDKKVTAIAQGKKGK